LLFADVTMRSKIDYRLGSYLPAAAAEGMNKQMAEALASGVVVRIKGKKSYSSAGPLVTISDPEKGTITLLDPKGKQFATCGIKEYGEKMKAAIPQVPEAAKQMLDNLKLDVHADKTGKTEIIKGIKTEEMLVTVTMDMPGAAAGAFGMKMEMHLWAATQEELERVPALKELAAYMTQQAGGTDPGSTASRMFGQIPGFGEKLKGPFEQLMKASSNAILRSEIKMMMPASAKMMGASNPDEPFTDITTDVTEISTDPVSDSVFQVPAGYKEVEIEELVAMMSPVRPGAPQQEPPAPAPPAQVPLPAQAGAYRVGGGVTAPVLIRKVEPEYSEEARQAHTEGTVMLYVEVTPDGKASNIRVVNPLPNGLNEKAIEAVRQWEFRPGMKDGRPVTVQANIELSFKTLHKPDEAQPPSPEQRRAAQAGGLPAKTTNPVLIRRTDPEYTEEARAAKFQGVVMLKAVVDTEGAPQDVSVVRSLGLGLDEKAIECVKNWKFRPATKDGNPVAMWVTIEVNFRLQ
jgi:TonB family protein